jgi:DNA-binding transcriptional ArsR family regulator
MSFAVNPRDCAQVLRAIGDETRIKILQLLFHGPRCVTEIAAALHREQPHISHHIGILRSAGLVLAERNGKRVLYSIHPDVASPIAAGESLDLGCCSVQFHFEIPEDQH